MADFKRTKIDKAKKAEKEIAQKAPVVQEEPEVLFIKRGSGRMVLNNRLIKPNEKFRAKLSAIPKVFRDLCERVYEDEATAATPEAPKRASNFRIVLIENSDVNAEVLKQIEDLEEFDFEDEESLTELREGLKQNGNEALADLDKDVLKDAILETLKSKYEYNIVNVKGKVQNEKPLSLPEAEKLVEVL